MTKLILLAIPVLIGVVVGLLMTSMTESEQNQTLLVPSKLIENGSPILGDTNAPITILEWGDYQCTYCYKFHQNTLGIINEDFVKDGKVRIVFKDFPLNGPDSLLAAQASYCAEDQGKYWEYHDELYKNWGGERTGWITRDSLEIFANTIHLDITKFNECLDSEKYHQRVTDIHEFGKEIGIDATPSFLIFNDEKVIKIRGNQPLEVFLKTFDEL